MVTKEKNDIAPSPEESWKHSRAEQEETCKEVRALRLGLTSHSTFLNMAVENQVTWPNTEMVVEFEGYRLILLPKTRDNTNFHSHRPPRPENYRRQCDHAH